LSYILQIRRKEADSLVRFAVIFSPTWSSTEFYFFVEGPHRPSVALLTVCLLGTPVVSLLSTDALLILPHPTIHCPHSTWHLPCTGGWQKSNDPKQKRLVLLFGTCSVVGGIWPMASALPPGHLESGTSKAGKRGYWGENRASRE
jgi:hypothetical protein